MGESERFVTGEYDVGDELLVPVIAGLLNRHLDDVRETYGSRLPQLRSPEFYAAPEHVQTAVLVVLGSAWLWGTPGLHLLRDVSNDVHAGDVEFWQYTTANHLPFAELQRRRGLRLDAEAQRWVVA